MFGRPSTYSATLSMLTSSLSPRLLNCGKQQGSIWHACRASAISSIAMWRDGRSKEFRQKIRAHELPPQLTEEEGTRLLRISVLQAIHNARAYCDDFDHLTASQQMAMSQLVFQMGVNLEEFIQFLGAINHDYRYGDSGRMDPGIEEG